MTLTTFGLLDLSTKFMSPTPLKGGVGSGDVRYDGNQSDDLTLKIQTSNPFPDGWHIRLFLENPQRRFASRKPTSTFFFETGIKTLKNPNLQISENLNKKSSPPCCRCGPPGGDIRAIKVIKKPSCSEGLQSVSNEAEGWGWWPGVALAMCRDGTKTHTVLL